MSKLDDRYAPQQTDEAAISMAAVTLAAFQHQNEETAQQHFRGILEILQRATDEKSKAPLWPSLERFASNDDSSAALIEKVSANGRTYRVGTTAGCIDFQEDKFTFMVRTRGTAPPCDRSR
jgi:hypothetical protein